MVYDVNYFLPFEGKKKDHGFKLSGKFVTMQCQVPQAIKRTDFNDDCFPAFPIQKYGRVRFYFGFNK